MYLFFVNFGLFIIGIYPNLFYGFVSYLWVQDNDFNELPCFEKGIAEIVLSLIFIKYSLTKIFLSIIFCLVK